MLKWILKKGWGVVWIDLTRIGAGGRFVDGVTNTGLTLNVGMYVVVSETCRTGAAIYTAVVVAQSTSR
jgi:hypothetical protein